MYHGWFFFFSSRRRHTRFDCDWSSDVCSSDLQVHALAAVETAHAEHHKPGGTGRSIFLPEQLTPCSQIDHLGNDAGFAGYTRSEERRVGEEGRSRWAPYH